VGQFDPCFNARMNNPQPWWLTWPVAEVAAAILPLFAAQPPKTERSVMNGIVVWCKTGQYHPGGSIADARVPFSDPDLRAITEATQVLEQARLLMRTFKEDSYIGLTRLGRHALQTNTVRQNLGLSDAPPTA
jgi:hypothetical protein